MFLQQSFASHSETLEYKTHHNEVESVCLHPINNKIFMFNNLQDHQIFYHFIYNKQLLIVYADQAILQLMIENSMLLFHVRIYSFYPMNSQIILFLSHINVVLGACLTKVFQSNKIDVNASVFIAWDLGVLHNKDFARITGLNYQSQKKISKKLF